MARKDGPMFEQAAYTHLKSSSSPFPDSERSRMLYRRARDRARRGQFWSMLTGKPRDLLDLKSIEASCDVKPREGSRCMVSIAQIGGSEGRASDFDREFNPLKDQVRKRWLGIAAAREQGVVLPPVSLVQVGDVYYVTDGHHRISVARAYGQEAIEAKVVVWQVESPLPWDASVHQPARQPTGIARAFGRLRREGARLRHRILSEGHRFTAAVRMALGIPAGAQSVADQV